MTPSVLDGSPIANSLRHHDYPLYLYGRTIKRQRFEEGRPFDVSDFCYPIVARDCQVSMVMMYGGQVGGPASSFAIKGSKDSFAAFMFAGKPLIAISEIGYYPHEVPPFEEPDAILYRTPVPIPVVLRDDFFAYALRVKNRFGNTSLHFTLRARRVVVESARSHIKLFGCTNTCVCSQYIPHDPPLPPPEPETPPPPISNDIASQIANAIDRHATTNTNTNG